MSATRTGGTDAVSLRPLACRCDKPAAAKRDEKYDAYYCPKCDAWLEGQCDDPLCRFCPGRPTNPSEVTP